MRSAMTRRPLLLRCALALFVVLAMPEASVWAQAAGQGTGTGAGTGTGTGQAAVPTPPTLAEGRALLQQGDLVGAEAVFQARTAANPGEGASWFYLGYAQHAQGKLEEAIPAHERAAGFAQLTTLAGYNAACAHARLGHIDQGLAWLGKAIAAGYGDRNQLETDNDLASLRADPRFATLLPPLLLPSFSDGV